MRGLKKKEADRLTAAMNQEIIDYVELIGLVKEIAAEGEGMVPMLESLALAVLSGQDERVKVEAHRVRANMRNIQWRYAQDSKLFLEYGGCGR